MDIAEAYSRELARQGGGDNCWSVTHYLRLPGSVNLKPQYQRPLVRVIQGRHNVRLIEERPKVSSVRRNEPVKLVLRPERCDWREVAKRYRLMKSYVTQAVPVGWRSDVLWLMGRTLHERGASADEIGSVLRASRVFQDKHRGDERALERLVGKLMQTEKKAMKGNDW